MPPASPPTRDQLLARLRDSFEIEQEWVPFGDGQLEIWRPADPDAALDDATLEQSCTEMQWHPYWAQAWDSSYGLLTWLSGRDWTGQQVLDLGCGLGISTAGLLAAGAEVVAGDNARPGLEFARLNTFPWNHRCRVREIDWRASRLNQRFDWIVGSDILYDRQQIEPLDRFFREHLGEGGKVLLADPSRPMTVEFLEQLQRRGWRRQTTVLASDPGRPPIRLAIMSPDPAVHSAVAGPTG